MNSDHRRAGASGNQPSSAMPQQPESRAMDRQQQQDNGTREFQPSQQQGHMYSGVDDAQHTLEAYLKRAGMRRELPVAAAGKAPTVASQPGNSGLLPQAK